MGYNQGETVQVTRKLLKDTTVNSQESQFCPPHFYPREKVSFHSCLIFQHFSLKKSHGMALLLFYLFTLSTKEMKYHLSFLQFPPDTAILLDPTMKCSFFFSFHQLKKHTVFFFLLKLPDSISHPNTSLQTKIKITLPTFLKKGQNFSVL